MKKPIKNIKIPKQDSLKPTTVKPEAPKTQVVTMKPEPPKAPKAVVKPEAPKTQESLSVTESLKPAAVKINSSAVDIVKPEAPKAQESLSVTESLKPAAVKINSSAADIIVKPEAPKAQESLSVTESLKPGAVKINSSAAAVITPPPVRLSYKEAQMLKMQRRKELTDARMSLEKEQNRNTNKNIKPSNTSNKPNNPSLQFDDALAEARSAVQNKNNINDIQRKMANLSMAIANTDPRQSSQSSGSPNISNVSTNVSNNNQQITHISADYLGQLSRDYETLPPWRTTLG